MCGENVLARYGADRLVWLIPACAGKTAAPSLLYSLSGAHPRVCGENFIPRPRAAPFGGSSPRVRGKPLSEKVDGVSERLIPACAGKTCTGRRKKHSERAHPRVCGENFTAPWMRPVIAGSSPRVRGKLGEKVTALRSGGLIPACAGKTPRR